MKNIQKFTSVVCVVKKRNQYLFCKRRDNGLWELPGGKIELGEKPTHAARRELFEETGILGKNLKFLGSWAFNYLSRHDLIAVYFISNMTGKIQSSDETPRIKFMNWDEINKRVPKYGINLLKKVEESKGEFYLNAGSFEAKTIFKYLIGKVKRKIL